MKIKLFKISFLVLLFTSIACNSYCQVKYSAKAEFGHLYYGSQLIRYERVEPSTSDFLTDKGGGNEINLINGIILNRFLFMGIGLSYLKLNNANGVAPSLDVELLANQKKLSPLFNLKLGQSFLKNDMGRKKSSTFGEFDFGLNYHLVPQLSTYAKVGIQITQNTSFLSIRGGVRF
ncbi:hypothetical protein ASE74_10530 [Pedobacter sp. Leaf216]|uniref:hypothetical protein n=1 Tax=Pedobacter sp. Leaf216 TaxID=1735684 RepID=UPI0006FCEAFB|nr:hypothetical protein [Pedobacter sp. Leaf216]KQM65291.1 hypothetical protein ASE74_10530 [Pedobacter sp. Leaf216]